MADYDPLLRRAIARLDQADAGARRDIYGRAREALIRQMRANQAPDEMLAEEIAAFDNAVAQIESEYLPEMPAPAPRRVRAAPEVAEEPAAPASGGRRIGLIVGAVLAAVIGAGLVTYLLTGRSQAPQSSVRVPAPQPMPTMPPPSAPAQSTAPQTRTAAAPAAPDTDRQAAKEPVAAVDVSDAPYVLRRQRVFYRTTHPPGTIVVSLSQKFLYLVQPNQVAIRYAIGTGPECDNVRGLFHITEKLSLSDPAQKKPQSVVRLNEKFGPRALYFDGTRAVHGAADPHQVGGTSTIGCFMSWKPDIVDLYDRVQLNDRVVVMN